MSDGRFDQTGPFKRVTNFGELNGRKKQRVLIGDQPHLLECRSLELTRVKHNWPSQWHSKYPGGYIIFDNGKRFAIFQQTIDEKPVFLFWFNEFTEVFYERFKAERSILTHLKKLPEEHAGALKHLVFELSGEKGLPADFIPFIPLSGVLKYLMRLSVAQLQDVDALLSIPGSELFWRNQVSVLPAPLPYNGAVGQNRLVGAL